MNHPNIAAIYGVEELDGARCLVLELVEGETLAERIARGPVPNEDALPVALQIARALENAHEKGIIHRDLKPANVKITPEGVAKVLDFGLAKAIAEDTGEPGDLSQSPTLSPTVTRAGVILGTAAYMSPEQAKGKQVDRRADIWSFGIVLLEMLAGKPAYHGETISETLAQVMMSEPPWEALPAATPERVRRLLERCLRKDPMSRLRDIGEARVQLEEMPGEPDEAGQKDAAGKETRGREKIAWLVAGAMALVAAFALFWPSVPESPSPPVRLELTPDARIETANGPALALSPVGSRLAYVAGSTRSLHVRSLSELDSTVLSGTEGARQPFFSPDGEWVAFFDGDELRRVSVHGGASVALCPAFGARGGSWGADGTVVFSNDLGSRGLWQVSAEGGEPVALATVSESEFSYRWPQHLPDGRHVLFTSIAAELDANDASVEVLSLDSGEKTVVYRGGFGARYVESGHLAFARDGSLFVAPFDAERFQLTGPPTPVVIGVASDAGEESIGSVQFSVSRSGALVYLPGTMRGGDDDALVWVDRDGTVSRISDEPASFRTPRMSPDGGRIIVDVGSWLQSDLWIYELERDAMTQLTFSDGPEWSPVWSPRRAADRLYVEDCSGRNDIPRGHGRCRRARLGRGANEPASDAHLVLSRRQAHRFTRMDPETSYDIWVRPMDGESEPRALLNTPFSEAMAQFSPDGRWLLYTSNASGGRAQAFVTRLPDGEGKWQVSTDGARFPIWSPTESEIFYLSADGDRMMAVSYTTDGDAFQPGRARELFRGRFRAQGLRQYDVSPDGALRHGAERLR